MGMTAIVLQTLSLFLAGILAGEEFVVRYGVHPALARLDDRAHIETRQALIRRLRILVPSIMIPTVLVGIAALVFGGTSAGFAFRAIGVAALVIFVLASFLGTVPINIDAGTWDAASPPTDWRAKVGRWGRIDVLRSTAAILAFACFAVAIALRLSAVG
jgi:hypothetical protein